MRIFMLILVPVLLALGIAGCIGLGLYDVVKRNVNAPMYQTIPDLPRFNTNDGVTNSPLNKHAIIALFLRDRKGTAQFHCSGVVISNKFALTAAHCIVDGHGFMLKTPIIIKDVGLGETGVEAAAATLAHGADIGLILGDFSTFNKMAVELFPGGVMGKDGPFITCGFPYGSLPLLCVQFIPIANYFFQIQGQGFLYPGMSGGPVISVQTNTVIGVNSEVGNGIVIVSPTTGLLGALDLAVE